MVDRSGRIRLFLYEIMPTVMDEKLGAPRGFMFRFTPCPKVRACVRASNGWFG